jgi:hypothetical protein
MSLEAPPGAKKPRPKGRGKVTFGSVKRIFGITEDATARPYHRAGSTEPGMISGSRNPVSRFSRDFFLSGQHIDMRANALRLSRISVTSAAVDKSNSVKYQINISTTS